ncbi:hypothetical protein HK102_001453 [Quaeritorhiza haematococci]|nr:hypothetical protein HK102_001453 [Quaeritorhiza haematococci]
MHNLFGSQTLNMEPQTGDAALQHLNRFQCADIILYVEDGGTFFAHRAYLTRSDRFKPYSEGNFVEGVAQMVRITAPIPSQFFDVLRYLYTQEILPDWFRPDQFARSLCTADYFMLEDVKKEGIKRFPSLWKDAIASSFFAPKWIPIEIVAELVALKKIQAADKIRIIAAWFRKREDLSPDAQVFGMVLLNCPVDSMTGRTLSQLRQELGSLLFNRVVPGSFLGEVYDRTLTQTKEGLGRMLAQIKDEHDRTLLDIRTTYNQLKSRLKVWACRCGYVYAYCEPVGVYDGDSKYYKDNRKCPVCSESYSASKVVTDVWPWQELENTLK